MGTVMNRMVQFGPQPPTTTGVGEGAGVDMMNYVFVDFLKRTKMVRCTTKNDGCREEEKMIIKRATRAFELPVHTNQKKTTKNAEIEQKNEGATGKHLREVLWTVGWKGVYMGNPAVRGGDEKDLADHTLRWYPKA